MSDIHEIGRLLGQTPVPSVVEGSHREQLKSQLLQKSELALRKDKKMGLSRFARMSPMMKTAVALLAAAVLVGTGWGAEKIYEKWKASEVVITLEPSQKKEVMLSDGTTTKIQVGGVTTMVDSDDPNAVEIATRHFEEDKTLIREKKYKFVKIMDFYGSKEYLYAFSHADGTSTGMNFSIPLETVDSWEDYEQKYEQRQKEIHNAVLAGKFRLVNCEVAHLTHICRDVESGEKICVQRMLPQDDGRIDAVVQIELPDGSDTMPDITAKPCPTQTTSWKEHLDAIRNGTRELLDMRFAPLYVYEIPLADGSKDHYVSEKLLKTPERKK